MFAAGNDPVADGIVASLNRPGGNITGITSIASELGSKRLGLLRELLPDIRAISLLVNTDNSIAINERKDAQAAAVALGRELEVFAAKNERDLELAFEMSVRRGAGAMIIVSDTFFLSRMARIADWQPNTSFRRLRPIGSSPRTAALRVTEQISQTSIG